MADPVWYRSLYWRFALGFVALAATLLAIQAFVFLWMTGRMADLFPSRSPAQFAATLSADVGAELTERPDADLQAFVQAHHGNAFRSFVIVMRDGRRIFSVRLPPPPPLQAMARSRLFGETGPERGGGGWPRPPRGAERPGDPPASVGPGGAGGSGGGPPPPGVEGREGREGGGRGGPGGPGGGGRRGRGGPPPPMAVEFAFIVVGGVETGIVAVPVEPPPLLSTLRDLGPTLATVALVLVIGGTAIAALVVIRPANRRLRDLQQAAQSLGAGASGVRANEAGGDEIASLAHAFNDMAGRLDERTRALEHADRTRRQLLADVSHELSTPLAAVRGYVETLGMSDLALDEAKRRRYLGIVYEETERLEHIVGDLLDLAKLEGGGAVFKMEATSIALIFDRIRRRHEQVLQERDIALETAIAGADGVIGDANRLEQALQNLVANAVRHTPAGGRVSVRSEASDDVVTITVEDTGPGIPPEHLPHVFDRFYKVDLSRAGTPVPSGSGLGLSIVQAIIARHGGRVTASNAPGGGARFQITLPCRTPA